MTAPSLLGCPFCGGRAITVKHVSGAFLVTGRTVAWGVECADCGCGTSRILQTDGAKTPYDTTDKATEAWNRRIPL